MYVSLGKHFYRLGLLLCLHWNSGVCNLLIFADTACGRKPAKLIYPYRVQVLIALGVSVLTFSATND
jgi:hypothetical protein